MLGFILLVAFCLIGLGIQVWAHVESTTTTTTTTTPQWPTTGLPFDVDPSFIEPPVAEDPACKGASPCLHDVNEHGDCIICGEMVYYCEWEAQGYTNSTEGQMALYGIDEDGSIDELITECETKLERMARNTDSALASTSIGVKALDIGEYIQALRDASTLQVQAMDKEAEQRWLADTSCPPPLPALED